MEWYVIFVKTGREEYVGEWIKRSECETISSVSKIFLPKRKIQERHNGVFIEKEHLMFPGYILIQSDNINELYYRTKSCKYIYNFLKSEEGFQRVDHEEISKIYEMTDDEGIVGVSNICIVNDVIKVMSGPLCNYYGVIRKVDRHKKRVKVAIAFKGREHLLDLSINIISKASESEIKATFFDFKRY